MANELIYDYFTFRAGLNEDWQEIMRQARLEYANSTPEQRYALSSSAEDQQMPIDMNSDLWQYAISFIRDNGRCATEDQLTRFCVRRGIRLSQYIRILRRHRAVA